MIKLIEVHLSFGSRPILEGVSWMLGDHDRVGLVGENGCGKSTLIKVLAGVEEFDRGRREVSRKLRIGYLPQEGITLKGRTLEEEVRSAVEETLALKEEHDQLAARLTTEALSPEEQTALLHRMAELEEQFSLAGGAEIPAKIGKVLAGLGFREEDRSRPVETFSGGWQMRIALAKLLLAEPQVLLLDEPTNHLDLEARNWLETYLQEFNGAYLIVSHDRYFLDVTVDRIVELENGKLTDFRGNYSYYLVEKERQVAAALSAYERQQEEIQRLNAFINKYKADKKRAGQVHSRLKMLERMELLEPPSFSKPIRFHFPPAPPSPQEMVRLEKVSKRYGDRVVLDQVSLSIFRGEKIAVVGPNGSGKSTLLSLLAGKMSWDGGTREENERVVIAYFGQTVGEEFQEKDTVLEAISHGAPFEMFPRLRSLLGAFLFRGDDVEKKVAALSGGEKSRLALARLLLRPANLLLMDEPTNHLDLRAKEVLMDAFQNFTGALVFVAHDRYFLENLPDRILEVKDTRVTSYLGRYSDYLWAKEKEAKAGEAELNKSAEKTRLPAPCSALLATSDNPSSPLSLAKEMEKRERLRQREEKKARQKREQRHQKRREELEKNIFALEEELKRVETEMTAPYVASDYLKLMELENQKRSVTNQLNLLYSQWESMIQEKAEGKDG